MGIAAAGKPDDGGAGCCCLGWLRAESSASPSDMVDERRRTNAGRSNTLDTYGPTLFVLTAPKQIRAAYSRAEMCVCVHDPPFVGTFADVFMSNRARVLDRPTVWCANYYRCTPLIKTTSINNGVGGTLEFELSFLFVYISIPNGFVEN